MLRTYPGLRKEEVLFWILHKTTEIISSLLMFISVTSPIVLYMHNIVSKYFLFIITLLPGQPGYTRQKIRKRIYACGWFVRMENSKFCMHPVVTIMFKNVFKSVCGLTFPDIKDMAKGVNQSLMRLISENDDKSHEADNNSMECDSDEFTQIQLDLGPLVDVLTEQLSHRSIQTRIAVLRWVLLLHMKTPNKVIYL